MGLRETCAELQETIRQDYGLGPGDAEDLFKLIWNAMADGVKDKKLLDTMQLIDEELL